MAIVRIAATPHNLCSKIIAEAGPLPAKRLGYSGTD
jgi:hypothetical protein